MQSEETRYWAHFCDFKGLDFRHFVMDPPSPFVASSQSNSTESHALHSERKLPDYFPHTVHMQAVENVWQRITVKSFVTACVCVRVCVFILSRMSELLPEQLKRQWDIYLQG